MMPTGSDKILTRKSTAQDDELKAHPPLIPPQWGNEFNNSPPWRGAACGGEGAFQFLKAQYIEQNPDTFLWAK
jgi:hypothetical protein